MCSKPKISIIIPVYNKQRYLNKLLQMIEAQSLREFECILIDDGSTDESAKICDAYSIRDSRFVTHHIINGGVSNARNVGLGYANGEYITFVDADDEVDTTYLENMYHLISSSNADMVISSHKRLYEKDNHVELNDYGIEARLYSFQELLPKFALLQDKTGIFGWCWGKLIKTEIAKKEQFNKEMRLAEDFDYYLRLYPLIQSIYLDDAHLYHYRINSENSAMTSIDDEKIDYYSQLQLNIRYKAFLEEMGVLDEESTKIIDTRLSNYTYFVLFHSTKEDFHERFTAVKLVFDQNQYSLHPYNTSSLFILFCVRNNLNNTAKYYMVIYRLIRDLIRDIRKYTTRTHKNTPV